MNGAIDKARLHLPFAWYRAAPAPSKRALLAASLGWMLDSFDIVLYSLLLPSIMRDLHLTKTSAGVLGSITLIAAAVGGICFGIAADRWGRTRAMILSVLTYAVFTAACGLSWSFASLAVFRIALGFGMGGEWATGATLVSETWSAEHRDKALALMQSAFAIGYGLAALVVFVCMPLLGWRGVFAIGLLPALLTLWIRRHVHEPDSWTSSAQQHEAKSLAGFARLFRPPLLRSTVALTTMNACCLFAWWGFNLWVPSFLALPVQQGGMGFSSAVMTALLVFTQIGMWLGYVSFGYLADSFGRRRTYVAFLLTAAALLVVYAHLKAPALLLAIGPCLAFAATGYFSGFAAVTADTYPTAIRASGQGFTYNLGRLVSAAAPVTAGALAQKHGFSAAFHLDAAAFLVAAFLWLFIPNTAAK